MSEHIQPMREHVAGMILAGGRGRRMGGRDKAWIELDGRPLVQHAIERLSPQVSMLILNINGSADPYRPFGLETVGDAGPAGQGPLAGLLAGLQWARKHPQLSHLVTVPVDSPFFPQELVERLLDATHGDPDRIVLARDGERLQPAFGLWPTSLSERLARFLNDPDQRKVTTFATGTGNQAHVDFSRSTEIDQFFNINTPADLEEACRYLAAQKGQPAS